jgi:PAS domain S-box-containing protein
MGSDARTVGGPTEAEEGAFLRAVLDHTNDVVLVLGADGTIRFASAASKWLLGRDPEQQIGQNALDLVHPDDVDDAVGALGRSVAAGAGPLPRKVLRVRHGDDTWRWVELSSYSLLDNPDVGGFVVTVREITERLSAEARFRAMLAHSADIVAIVEADGIVRWGSAAGSRLLGHPSGDSAPDVATPELVHPDDLPAMQKRFRELVAGAHSFDQPMAVRVRDAQGSWHDLEIMATNLLDDPNVQGVLLNCRDVTERKEVERRLQVVSEELARSNADLDQFALVASHDLQEPLRTLDGFAALLQQRYVEELDESGREFIGYIRASAARMRTLINDLLEYSRAGRADLRLETLNPNELIEEVTQLLRQAIEDSSAQIVVRELPIIAADRRQLERLFQNLISNAIKFRGQNPPRIEVSAMLFDQQMELRVADNGIGIDPAHMDRIFNVFDRLHAREQYDGSGIGLAICRRIVERHEGRIWAEPRPDGGTVICFTLPIRAARPA